MTKHVLVSSIFSKNIQEMEVKFDMIIRKRSFFGILKASYACEFLLDIHVYGLCQDM